MGGSRYHPKSLMPRRRRTLIIQNSGSVREVGEPPSTPASFDSFNQRGAGSPAQRIIEEDETLSNNSNAPYPVAGHPYPGAAAAGGGGTSGIGSGGTSRNGSGTCLALSNASNLSADTRARLATLSHAHSISQSQHEVPGLGGGGMTGGGGGGGYAPSIVGMSDVMSFGNRSMSTIMANPVLLAGALQAEVKAGRNLEIFDSFKPFYCPSSKDLHESGSSTGTCGFDPWENLQV
ncbi:hypothetical protein K435DRAFT_858398 [Dendrothele bispora CBS 962.96]|uniref:Uncharacterized protein n=1 Tax=Dendrothele bispora (strain CBS 962.96) TaxID=1314807 RepID=A0A4S8M4F2_DENBC|nr:hypothetical protein K435DRAFT_858398 [Dendrothele bispora CBS 962.96]